mgnify:CR=1 FL=1
MTTRTTYDGLGMRRRAEVVVTPPTGPPATATVRSWVFAGAAGDELVAEAPVGSLPQAVTSVAGLPVSQGGMRFAVDGLGSVIARVNAQSGTLLTAEHYDAWGNSLTQAPTTSEPSPSYAGLHWDDAVSKSYAHDRWYDSLTGTWLTNDRVFGSLENPASLNPFSYSDGAPTRFVDPRGQFSVSPSTGEVVIEKGDTSADALRALSLLSGNGLLSDEYVRMALSRYAGAAENFVGDPDLEQIQLEAVAQSIRAGLQHNLRAWELEERNALQGRAGREFAQKQNVAGVAAGETGAEVTVMAASLLGFPTSKQDVVLSAGIPLGAGVVLKFAPRLLGKILAVTRGARGEAAVEKLRKAVARGDLPGVEFKCSGCEELAAKAGGGIKVTDKGIARVEGHLKSIDALNEPANAAMIDRLKAGMTSPQDINFYMHELKESAFMRQSLDPRCESGPPKADGHRRRWRRAPR